MQQREAAGDEPRVEAALEEAANIDRRFELLARTDELVEADEGHDPVEIGFEAPLQAKPLECGGGGLEVPGELADPGLGEHGQLVDFGVALAVVRGHPPADTAGFI